MFNLKSFCQKRVIAFLTLVSAGTIAAVFSVQPTVIAASFADENKQAKEPQAAVVQIVPASREKPSPGSVLMKNGLIYSGMCSKATTLAPLRSNVASTERFNQHLEMRMVDQKARELYLPIRHSERPVPDNLVWPNLTFEIRQKRQSRKTMPAGVPTLSPFNSEGLAEGKLYRVNGKVEEIQAGIVSINELYAEVNSLTHDWSYAIAFDAIPRESLRGILEKVTNYDTQADVRLNLVRMLIKANRLPEAESLFETVKMDFPELAGRQEYQQQIREQIAGQITAVLEERRDVGQHQLAANFARIHPKNDLTPETVVRVNQLIRFYTDTNRRMERVQAALPALLAEIEDPKLREPALMIHRLIANQIDADTIDRFVAFELLADAAANAEPAEVEADADNPISAEEQLALAFSGWLMGADNTVKNLRDVISLYDAREHILDYLNTDSAEDSLRQTLADRISKMEGVGIERVAAIVRHLPAIQPPSIETSEKDSSGRFSINGASDAWAMMGLVPPEYHETRKYPVVIVFHGRFDTAEKSLGWWRAHAEKHGYIVVAPQWLPEESGPAEKSYVGSAESHQKFQATMRKIRNSLRVDDDRIFVAGHDLGGDAALDIATSHSDMFAGIISICGVAQRHLQWTASNAIQVPWYVVIGDAQGDWFERMGILAGRFFKRDDEMDINFDMVFVKYPFRGLERYTEEVDDVFSWMSRQTRTRHPEKVYARLLRSTDVNWWWVRLKSLPPQFAQLDTPDVSFTGAYRPAEINVRRDNRNLFRVKASPADLTLLLSPEMSGLDVNQPIRIHNGRKTSNVDYHPQISHLLDELYQTGDRSRLCYMRVEVTK
jgi:pimeloyl-ACP methyl ester carboxylesterase